MAAMASLKVLVVSALLCSVAGAGCDAKDHPDDCEALCDLSKAAVIDGWCNGTTVCGWPGITCTYGRVTELSLNGMVKSTSGPIPDSIGRLVMLKSLDLTNCKFSGRFPESIGNLFGLTRLWLGENNMTGGIPSSVGKLVNLQQFVLHYNRQLGGSIPDSIGNMKSLGLLLLNNNSLTGSVPSSIGKLSSLSGLGLFSNHLTAWSSNSICKLIASGSLSECLLNDNQFACPLPACAANCSATCKGAVVV